MPLREQFQELCSFLIEPSTAALKMADTVEMKVIQDLAFGGKASDKGETVAYHRGSNVEVRREHMWCLKPGRWLTDDIINIYMALLQVSVLTQHLCRNFLLASSRSYSALPCAPMLYSLSYPPSGQFSSIFSVQVCPAFCLLPSHLKAIYVSFLDVLHPV